MSLDRGLVAALVGALALTAISGVALGWHYQADPDLAHDSVRMLEQEIAGGAWLRSIHWLAANCAIALTITALLAALWRGCATAPRCRLVPAWAALLFLLVTAGAAGELLVFDEQAWFATQIRIGVLQKLPLAGTTLADVARGGDAIGATTLARFHFLHVALLPLALLALLGWQRRLLQPLPAAPLAEAGAAGGVALAIVAAAAFVRLRVGAVAEPGDPGFAPFPEWHMVWLNQLLHLCSGSLELLATAVVPGLLAMALLAIPQLERWLGRARLRIAAGLVLLALGGLTAHGFAHAPAPRPNLDYPLGALTAEERAGYLAVRRHKCLDCHRHGEIGKTEHDAPDLDEIDHEVDVVADILADPEGTIDSKDMPSYAQVPVEERRAIGHYLRWLNER
jgi:quinol-cytochrome oxidoreductase complex cytochrome b subunit